MSQHATLAEPASPKSEIRNPKSKIAITGGGTGGHVSPAVAMITRLRERSAVEGWDLDLLYVGSVTGVERRIITGLGVPYKAIQTGKLRRYLSLETPLDLMVRLPAGFFQALSALRRFKPDVIFSTGGYVCVPTVIAGRMLGVPSLTHEQTALVGLANRVAGRFADRVAISFPRSASFFPPGKTILTGNPVRPTIFGGDASRAAQLFGFEADQPTLYVTGGAQGSHAINMAVREALPRLLACCQVLHQCGEGPDGSGDDLRVLAQTREQLPPDLRQRYHVQAFVGEEIGDVYALASLVVGRAGAGTVNELASLGKPSVLVPLPGSAGGEQEANARAIEKEGGAVVLLQSDLTPDSLTEAVCALIGDTTRLRTMGEGAGKLAMPGAADAIIDELMRLVKSGSRSA
ncbi:MAG: undecaprenyldiphospho-muramoylpentapeptide beta-N-acetylglucosaminyltransferase [Chloroflexota bacterium]|nr:undecaprenyldiphospho-muramoylpentapeptide beta-N-acetylglucosaminyltransferase [Chloroflexota bacterium]MDQ5866681.1 undecaprenyldiphospho-muramoylpentapeptide beta-N-acetylglucosaminyltransferase [Chloroflexota bacterium]